MGKHSNHIISDRILSLFLEVSGIYLGEPIDLFLWNVSFIILIVYFLLDQLMECYIGVDYLWVLKLVNMVFISNHR